jgi:hypothetical protein
MPLIDSHVNPCDKFFQSAPRKWKKKRCIVKEPQKEGCTPLIYVFHSTIVIIGSDQPNRREKKR